MDDPIRIRGARQHNLKNIDLDIPRRSFTVVTGPSGSGKSSLALDTLFAEGQRRYVESLSTYAKQFLERMEKPLVDSIEGISPAVAIEQKNPTKTSRSTVGTATEVYDYMRLLWARVGRTHCPVCDRHVQPDTVGSAADRVLALEPGTRIQVTFPLPRGEGLTHEAVVEYLRAMGFVRVLADGALLDLSGSDAATIEGLGSDLTAARELLVVVDRLKVDPDDRERLADSLGTCFVEGEGEAVVLVSGARGGPGAAEDPDGVGPGGGGAADGARRGARPSASGRLPFTERFRCPDHPDIEFLRPSPQLFSFNSPYGTCPKCTGFGATLEYDVDLIVPDHTVSLANGAVDPWSKPRYKKERGKLDAFARDRGISTKTAWGELPEDFRDAVLHGTKGFKGVVPFLVSRERKKYKQYIRVFLRQYQSPRTCSECGGGRVRPQARYVRVGGRDIAEASAMPLEDLASWVRGLVRDEEGDAAGGTGGRPGGPGAAEADAEGGRQDEGGDRAAGHVGGGPTPALSPMETQIAESILRELRARVGFLVDVGLGYLTLDRQTRTLSGGEAQRINLANSLGSSLVDTLYVLDEPTVGLHPRDTGALLGLLRKLSDGGNTVVVVEHDPRAIRAADHVVELGPASGEQGGRIVYQGPPGDLPGQDTATGRYLSGRSGVPLPSRTRDVRGRSLSLRGARLHNVIDADIEIPLGTLTVVTGVSGSGKSTLVHDILYHALERVLNGESSAKEHLGEVVGAYDALEGARGLDAVVLVDQTPIGRTPRSNPVTYVKAWDHVRKVFADQPLSHERGYGAGQFSFNTAGGRCEECKGAGYVEIEMVFMADVYVPCDACGGRRYTRETLDVKVKGKNVSEVLDLTVDEAIRFFIRERRLGKALWHLQQVGLGYLRLGQPAPTLSGGEAQRLKIARELSGAAGKKGRKLYILDEPTTGLAGEDVGKLVDVLERLVDAGNTVLVIEHDMDVAKIADWIIDMGPGAGHRGGEVVAMGPPRTVAHVPGSVTARYLAEALEGVVEKV